MNSERKTIIRRSIYYNDKTWLLNTYLIKSNEDESISDKEVRNLIENLILELESTCISNEFEYLKTGFVFIHYGNRGINVSIWHIGKWGFTYELYSCSWYCYGRNIATMELLDSAEPVISQYEIKYLLDELKVCSKIIEQNILSKQFRDMYIETWKRNEVCCI